jgi:hypothetical protein
LFFARDPSFGECSTNLCYHNIPWYVYICLINMMQCKNILFCGPDPWNPVIPCNIHDVWFWFEAHCVAIRFISVHLG